MFFFFFFFFGIHNKMDTPLKKLKLVHKVHLPTNALLLFTNKKYLQIC